MDAGDRYGEAAMPAVSLFLRFAHFFASPVNSTELRCADCASVGTGSGRTRQHRDTGVAAAVAALAYPWRASGSHSSELW
jgi:hypothetical protein